MPTPIPTPHFFQRFIPSPLFALFTPSYLLIFLIHIEYLKVLSIASCSPPDGTEHALPLAVAHALRTRAASCPSIDSFLSASAPLSSRSLLFLLLYPSSAHSVFPIFQLMQSTSEDAAFSGAGARQAKKDVDRCYVPFISLPIPALSFPSPRTLWYSYCAACISPPTTSAMDMPAAFTTPRFFIHAFSLGPTIFLFLFIPPHKTPRLFLSAYLTPSSRSPTPAGGSSTRHYALATSTLRCRAPRYEYIDG
ncbi:hypothetical protein C8R44DRAFT_887153 [Mycena epipterygia]|nr:hypothetical protein C8R44DRAFT_887153 [Mycena epipterygia]